MTRRPPAAAIWTALVAVYLFWGSTYLGIRFAIDSLPPFLMAATRFALAGAILFTFAKLRGHASPTWRHWLSALGIGFLLLGAGNGAVVWAEQTVPSGLVAVTVSSSPIWMVLIDRVFSGGRVTWPQAAGVGLGLAGIFVLVNPSTAVIPLLPTVVLLASSVAWAAGTLYTRHAPLPASASMANGMEMLMGALVLAVVAAVRGEPAHVHPEHFTAVSLAAVLYLVVAGSLIGFSCYLWLIKVAPVPLVATQSYVSPVVAVLLGVLLRGEPLRPRTLVAGAVIIAAVCLIASAPLLTSGQKRGELKPTRAA